MCIVGALYDELRENNSCRDVCLFSVRNDCGARPVPDGYDDDSAEELLQQQESDKRTLAELTRMGDRLRNRILSFVP